MFKLVRLVALLIALVAVYLPGYASTGNNSQVAAALNATPSSTAQSCEFDCFTGSGMVARQQLSFKALTSATSIPLLDYAHYGVPANAANPTNQFNATLKLTVTAGTLTEQGTKLQDAYTDANTLPPFEFTFVQHGTHLLPLQRQVINTGHPTWEWLLLPGRVWNENADQGYSRVALPFALQEVNANCTHNGVMTFVFNNAGNISEVAYQIAQETCPYFKFNLHGKVSARVKPASIDSRPTVIQDYQHEWSQRIVTKPLSALASDYPAAALKLAKIASDQSASHLTAFGVLVEGVHYQGGCATRSGDYPFCQLMALPSYSTAKTLVAGLGVMRAAQVSANSILDLTVKELVAACASQQWQDVTLLNALDMATGNYHSPVDSADESAQRTLDEFFLRASHADKIRHSCSYPRQVPPGTQFVYHTSDTYLVSRMLQKIYQQQAGEQADYFNHWLVNDLYRPLALSPLSYRSKRTYDREQQVWGGYGLTLLADDLLKLGRFIALHNGRINGQPMLDQQLLAGALQQSQHAGLSTGANSRYQHSVWAYNVSASALLDCSAPTWVPYLSGFGGIGVVLLPNDMIYYYVSDNYEYGFINSVAELAKISPLCSQT